MSSQLPLLPPVEQSDAALLPPVELQVETMSSLSTRVFLYFWYAVLLLGLLLESNVRLQWKMDNFCDGDAEMAAAAEASITHFDTWNSSLCLSWESYWTASAPPAHFLGSPSQPTLPTLERMWWAPPLPEVKRGPVEVSPASLVDPNGIVAEEVDTTTTAHPTMQPLRRVYKLRWTSESIGTKLDRELHRFVHVVVSLASPQMMDTSTSSSVRERSYSILIALEETPSIPPDNRTTDSSGSSCSSGPRSEDNIHNTSFIYTYNTSVTCWADYDRCSSIVLPPSVVVVSNSTSLSITLLDVPVELAEATILPFGNHSAYNRSSGVGLIYQRASFTIATLVGRYVLLVISLVMLFRFWYHNRLQSRMIYEQYWTLVVQVGLVFYLNPLFWWCVYSKSTSMRPGSDASSTAASLVRNMWHNTLFFFEFHIPNYFVALVACYTFSLIAGSSCLRGPYRHRSGDGTVASTPTTVSLSSTGGGQLLTAKESSTLRRRVIVLAVLYFCCIAVLDICKCALENRSWGMEVTCVSPRCRQMKQIILYTLLGGLVASGVALRWLQRSLGTCSYLSTRPQQLACRILIFFYLTSVLYCAVQVGVLRTIYPLLLTVLYSQPLLKASHLCVLTCFVNQMAYVYTSVRPSRQIPLRPSDPRWKLVGWPRRWLCWLDWHGGSMYIFFNEAEERRFYRVQLACHMEQQERQQRTKRRRRRRSLLRRRQTGEEQGGVIFHQGASQGPYGVVADEAVQGPRYHEASHRYMASVGRRHTLSIGIASSDREGQSVLPAVRSAPLFRAPSCSTVDGVGDETASDDGSAASHGGSSDGGAPSLPHASGIEVEESASPLGSTTALATDDASFTKHYQKQQQRLSRYSSRMLDATYHAENRLLDGTATFLDFLSEAWVERPLQVLLQRNIQRRCIFFNLETAIDCYNLSWEAYGVVESQGDQVISTGIQVDAVKVPRVAMGLIERAVSFCFGVCCRRRCRDGGGDRDEPVGETDARDAVVEADGSGAWRETTAGFPQNGGCTLPSESVPLLSPAVSVLDSTKRSGCDATSYVDSAAASFHRKPHQWMTAPSADSTTAVSSTADPLLNTEQYGYIRVAVLDGGDVQVVISKMDTVHCPLHTGKHPRLVIAFRGTNNAANARQDIRFQQRVWKEVETPPLTTRATVHRGFLELWISLKEQVLRVVLLELQRQCRPLPEGSTGGVAGQYTTETSITANRSGIQLDLTGVEPTTWVLPPALASNGACRGEFLRLYVTGHSLGGALASLCAYSLRRLLLLIHYPEPDVVVYTFGQPCIGNYAFQQQYNKAVPCTFRVVNESDAVSGVYLFGGHHVGELVNIDRHGNYICKPMYIEQMFRPTRGRGFAVLNHTMAAYADSLNAIAEGHAAHDCPVRCSRAYAQCFESTTTTTTTAATVVGTISADCHCCADETEQRSSAAEIPDAAQC